MILLHTYILIYRSENMKQFKFNPEHWTQFITAVLYWQNISYYILSSNIVLIRILLLKIYINKIRFRSTVGIARWRSLYI